MKILRILSLALVAFVASALPSWAGDPTGTWTFKAEGPKGRTVESTLILKWEKNQLSGTIKNQAGETEISQARFTDDQVTFSVNRKIRRRSFVVNYTGKLAEDTITGTINATGREGKAISLPWEAHRTK